ncbi:hypothetical protein THF1D04_400009 [Vibrio owensii]|uniref:Transposase n=1 Tax=Vibrio owensii TaxID=696485 RepID=A0AAU9QB31_9VIBR|nr:hypothetical protein THF1D04_400009 [Vibrio owensii]
MNNAFNLSFIFTQLTIEKRVEKKELKSFRIMWAFGLSHERFT